MSYVKHGMLWVGLLLVAFVTWAAESALPMLEHTANQIIRELKTNQTQLKTDPSIIQHLVQQYFLPHVDVTGMSRSVLGRNAWGSATAAEKQAFTHEFTQLVVRTYATPLAQYSGETVVFSPKVETTAGGNFSRVNSVIHRPNGQRIPLSYALVLQQGEWKIYDLSIEGVSLLQSFRNQFSQVLQHASLHDLIVEMKTHKPLGAV